MLDIDYIMSKTFKDYTVASTMHPLILIFFFKSIFKKHLGHMVLLHESCVASLLIRGYGMFGSLSSSIWKITKLKNIFFSLLKNKLSLPHFEGAHFYPNT